VPTASVDITATCGKKRQALFAHHSQDGERVYAKHPGPMEEFRGRERGVAAAKSPSSRRPPVPIDRDGRGVGSRWAPGQLPPAPGVNAAPGAFFVGGRSAASAIDRLRRTPSTLPCIREWPPAQRCPRGLFRGPRAPPWPMDWVGELSPTFPCIRD
jgi:hypothetical protein